MLVAGHRTRSWVVCQASEEARKRGGDEAVAVHVALDDEAAEHEDGYSSHLAVHAAHTADSLEPTEVDEAVCTTALSH